MPKGLVMTEGLYKGIYMYNFLVETDYLEQNFSTWGDFAPPSPGEVDSVQGQMWL